MLLPAFDSKVQAPSMLKPLSPQRHKEGDNDHEPENSTVSLLLPPEEAYVQVRFT